MRKIDYKKDLSYLYNPKGEVAEVMVPEFNFLMVDGRGDPNNSKEFSEAIEALFSLSYTIKFFYKKGQEIDYGVLPLEGLWWADDMKDFDPIKGNKANWYWTAMIMQPDFVTSEIISQNTEALAKKKKLAALDKVKFEKYNEGKSAQIMHIGPFSEEGPNIKLVHDYISAHGGMPSGKHHEIYLSDMRRVAPEKMKTIVRQPFV